MPRALPAALAAAALAALGVAAVCTVPVVLEPGLPSWQRLVRGTADGRLSQRSVIMIPGLDRSETRRLLIVASQGVLVVGIDGGPGAPVRVPREGLALAVSASRVPGLRVDIESGPEPVKIERVLVVDGVRPWRAPAIYAFALVLFTILALRRWLGLGPALALGLTAASAIALSAAPAVLWLSLPRAWVLARLLLALLPLAGALVVLARVDRGDRRLILNGAGLIACAVFGAFIRGYFLPSSGSWDMEYWKAWSDRAASSGVARVYGDADAVPEGYFLAQLRGQEERWKIEWRGRAFTVDYPPLAMALWRWSSLAVTGLEPDEARSVAAKLPAVAGDLLSVPVLLWVLRRRALLGLWLSALYWALPVSWLSSAVLGFLDGACSPFLLLALAASGERRPGPAGAALALAALIKPTSLIVAPAMVVALLARGASVSRAVAAGSAVVALALLPFTLAGTLQTAVIHVYQILFQERLSGGFPNPWWLVGHVLTLGASGWAGAVQFARIELFPLPARATGSLLFAAAASFIVWRQHGRAGSGPALLSGAALFFSYGMLAVGVHENHPHPLFLLLMGTGLLSWRLRGLWAGATLVYTLNMLLMSGLGRFHGLRYAALEPITQPLAGWRLAAGFDLTLLLALLNLGLFAWMLRSLGAENEALGLRDNEGAGGLA